MDFIISRRQMLKLGASAAVLGLAGCGSNSSASDGGAAEASGDVKDLTFEPGKLTVATGNPAWEPWVMNDDPESGEGFEAAVIYALAERMGFAKEEVVWTRSDFEQAFAPGEHEWDLNIQQVSINEDRKKAVDFSPAYFVPTQSVIVLNDGAFANATSVADLADAVIGVQSGTTAIEFANALVKDPKEQVRIYPTNVEAATDVKDDQIDALVTDTPQCVYMVESGQVGDKGVVIGQIPNSTDDGLGIAMTKDSPLVPFVTDAMNAILDDGTIDGLIDTWLKAYTSDIPTLAE